MTTRVGALKTYTMADLDGIGRSEWWLRRQHRIGNLTLVVPGVFGDSKVWEHASPATQYAEFVRQAWNRVLNKEAVVSHVSAAALWGLPLPRRIPEKLHLSGYRRGYGRETAWVIRHRIPVSAEDITEIHGVRCTTLERTVIDVAMSESMETSVMCADSALRRHLSIEDNYLSRRSRASLAGAADTFRDMWKDGLQRRTGQRGVRQARFVAEFADWRADSPGESVSRLRLHQVGVPAPELQVMVDSPHGTSYFVDFLFRQAQVFGEFDGTSKYGLTPEQIQRALLQEKEREDWIRATTGWRGVRWGWRHISSQAIFESFAARAGLI